MPKIAKLLTEKEIKALKVGDHAVGGRGLYIKKRETFSCYYVRIRKDGTESLLSKISCSLTLASTFTVNPGPRKLKVINKPLLIK